MTTIQQLLARAFQLHQAGDVGQAIELYQQVLASAPNHATALNGLEMLANDAERSEEAIACLRRAVALRPDEAALHSHLAIAYHAAGEVAAAIAEYREALRLQPAWVEIHVDLGQTLLELGQEQQALDFARQAVALNPDSPAAYGLLSELAAHGRYAFADEEIRRVEVLLETGSFPPDHVSLLHTTLGRIREIQGNYDEAFHSYRRANELKREFHRQFGLRFDRQKHVEMIDGLIATFHRDFFERVRSMGIATEKPVFVVGMVRSGTSLVEQILASHPQVFGWGELKELSRMSAAFYTGCLSGLDALMVYNLAQRYLQRVTRSGGAEAARVIDKLPYNYLHLAMIAVLFPQARIIHCRRDPLDVCVSAFTQNFQMVPYTTSLEDLGFYHRQYARLMDHWRQVLPAPMHEVVYEDLVANQERVSRDLIAYCGLPWDDRCLEFHKNRRAVQTASKLQVRQPVYTHAVARWKRYEAHLQPLRDHLAGPPWSPN